MTTSQWLALAVALVMAMFSAGWFRASVVDVKRRRVFLAVGGFNLASAVGGIVFCTRYYLPYPAIVVGHLAALAAFGLLVRGCSAWNRCVSFGLWRRSWRLPAWASH